MRRMLFQRSCSPRNEDVPSYVFPVKKENDNDYCEKTRLGLRMKRAGFSIEDDVERAQLGYVMWIRTRLQVTPVSRSRIIRSVWERILVVLLKKRYLTYISTTHSA